MNGFDISTKTWPLHYDSALWHPSRGVYLEAPAGYVLFQHVGLLEDALLPHPDVRIVLSTNWARALRFSRAKRRLPVSLQARAIGATYHTELTRRVSPVADARRLL